MKKYILILIFCAIGLLKSYAQEPPAVQLTKPINPPISVELFGGSKYGTFQNFISKKFTPTSRFGLYHIATYNVDYKSALNNTMVIQSIANVELFKGLTGGVGGYMSTVGFHPIAALQYTYSGKTLFATVLPTVNMASQNYQSLLMIIQYRPVVTDKVKLYSRLQVYNSFTNFDTRTYTYEQLRLGLEVSKTQFGVGVTFEQYQGQLNLQNANVGFFIRKEIFN